MSAGQVVYLKSELFQSDIIFMSRKYIFNTYSWNYIEDLTPVLMLLICLFGLMSNLPVNSYGHVQTVSSPNHFFMGKLD